MAEVNLAEIKFGVAVGDRQTAKLNSPPNFPAIRYIIIYIFYIYLYFYLFIFFIYGLYTRFLRGKVKTTIWRFLR